MTNMKDHAMLSVTEVLQVFSDFSRVSPARLDKAAKKGIEVHSICAAHALGLWIPEIPEEVAGYFASFLRWWPQVKEVLFVEKEFRDTQHDFLGHPDLGVVLIDGRRAVVDLKTPLGNARTWAGQCAAYLDLTRPAPYHMEVTGTLQLDPAGGIPRMRWYNEDGRDWYAFLTALYSVKYFMKGE